MHHFGDIAEFLTKFEGSISNSIAIIDRCFVELADVLKPILCATALLGHHITRPFHRLVIDTETTYDTLLSAFPKLHREFSIDPKRRLTLSKVFSFVPS